MGQAVQIIGAMKKITILVDQLHAHGGIEKLVALKANYWSSVFGYQVTIVSTEQQGRPTVYPLSEQVEFVDLAINYNRSKSYFSFENAIKCLSNIFKIQKYIIAKKPDFIVVASHIPVTYFLPLLFRKGKIAKEFHFTKFERVKQKGIKTKTIDFIEGLYDFLVVLSPEEKTFYPSKNAVVIPNPVEIPEGIVANISQNHDIAIAVVRFAPVKQLEKMIAAWKLFVARNPSWQLHIFGATGNDYFRKTERLVNDGNLTQSVIFRGASDNIPSELSKAKVLLMTSEQECFPMVILEANSVGIPVISFDSPTGPRNIIGHKVNGIIVDYDNCDSFAAELEIFARDARLQEFLSGNSLQNAKNYRLDAIMQLWRKLIFEAHD